MDTLLEADKALFLFLNSLGSASYDPFWMLMTHRASNVVIYFILWVFYGVFYSWKQAAYLLVFTLLLLLSTDQMTNLFKSLTERLRPCYDSEIQHLVRLVKPTCGGIYSFFSGHASNSFALAVFFSLLLSSISRLFIVVLPILALLIGYSRIYIGVHFPLDVIVGTLAGSMMGVIFYTFWLRFNQYVST